jgi:hypothetical protein
VDSKARQDDPLEPDAPEGSPPPPRISTFRPVSPRSFEGDPRAVYTRALVNIARAGDIAHLLVPSEILEAFCDAVAKPLGLVVAVVIEAPDGLPRSLPWKSVDTDWKLLEHAERQAWTTFAELLAPDLLESLPAEATALRAKPGLHWTVQTLAIPLLGILQCGTRGPVRGADHGLLKYMSVRLSTALGRRRLEDDGRSSPRKA